MSLVHFEAYECQKMAGGYSSAIDGHIRMTSGNACRGVMANTRWVGVCYVHEGIAAFGDEGIVGTVRMHTWLTDRPLVLFGLGVGVDVSEDVVAIYPRSVV